jgi:hypothetical protein
MGGRTIKGIEEERKINMAFIEQNKQDKLILF